MEGNDQPKPAAVTAAAVARKTINPFVTYAVNGLGTTMQTYRHDALTATIAPSLAVRGEKVTDSAAQLHASLPDIPNQT